MFKELFINTLFWCKNKNNVGKKIDKNLKKNQNLGDEIDFK